TSVALAEIRIGELVEVTGATADARARYQQALGRLQAGDPMSLARQAAARAHLGHALRREGELATADVELAHAMELYRVIGDQEGIAAMGYERAVIALFREEFAIASERLTVALALARSLGARQLVAAITSGLGVLCQETGESDAAIAHHAEAVQVFRDLGNRHREGSALYYLACAYLERGELREAHVLLDQAAAAIRAVGAQRYETLIEAARGAAHARAGDPVAADAAFASADRLAAACQSEPALLGTLAIHRLQRSTLDGAARVAEGRAVVASAPGDDPRFALRVLVSPTRARADNALIVRAGCSAFRPPGAVDDVDLTRRQPLRLLVAALARHRV
ncbi:MAG: tetratricopeptide repeat protein, partial [Proteobacteria bacterium]|nr:tetratricopeptide repeat protein [Pseudomonadota bacterium]